MLILKEKIINGSDHLDSVLSEMDMLLQIIGLEGIITYEGNIAYDDKAHYIHKMFNVENICIYCGLFVVCENCTYTQPAVRATQNYDNG